MKLRCFFDVDGVLLDFEKNYLEAIREYYHLDIPKDYKAESWHFSDLLNEEQLVKAWEYFIRSDYFMQLPSLVNVEKFNQVFQNYPVHLVTNIPPFCLPKRSHNLSHIGLQYQSLHTGGFMSYDALPPITKAEVIREIIQEEETVLFVDDHPKNCINVLESFPSAKIWLMSRPFNQEFVHETIPRANDWEDIFATL